MAASTSNGQQAAQQVVTPQLRQWIIAQAEAGCRPEDVLAAMQTAGWKEDVAIRALEDTMAQHLASQSAPAPAQPTQAARAAEPVVQATAVPEPALSGEPTVLWAGDRQVQVLLTCKLPRVVVFGNFMSDEECDQLVALATPRMARSETVVNLTGGSEVNDVRTSDGMFFQRAENELCERIERRIAALVNWPVENGEGLQILHYRPGAQYEPHYDYFDPSHPGTATILARGGQRVGTLVMYLNTPEAGGGTTFPDAGLYVAPRKGNAVFFSYDRPHSTTRTLHGGAPVIAGEKWVATKWMRQGEFI
ncbi:2OG-Fe(II) oxygenase [Ideonella sp. 4Y11]|uniref:2OG-Fe(II) oxygenase n=1 Tax=Ideonella aquatica TaxID=2824119 RepID=A0A940YZ73_9BURK|nr:2OG-Fe(II) oxygenase [Ideonella aquatica]MBQ0961840.1 2OG-Fe(II) oxygenase [Ideonella aquatica]